ncbi:MAG TPA: NAD(P)H-dependent oxidoreductase [Candidatus Sulfotelmatobacter sp.]|nr:NAD(P)H-dependent oxidoreductase [Candidatus Sulfotelmatobacter sp.]
MSQPVKVGLIYGSTRQGRFCDIVARWTEKELGASGNFSVELIDPVAHSRAAHNKATAHNEGTAHRLATHGASDYRSLRTQLAEADAFVVVTPEYNHGYPAALKELIDSTGEEWYAKPVAFVSYGGVSGGLRAVEQLRQVFAELHVVSIRDSVSFQNAWQSFDGAGCPADPDRCSAQMSRMLAKLYWWAIALRTARETAPYSTAA